MSGAPGLGATNVNVIQTDGVSQTVNSVAITVLQRDSNGDISLCYGTTKPTDGSSGYAIGCRFINTGNTSAANQVFENSGSRTSSSFQAIDLVSQGVVVVETNGTTPVNVFGTTNGFNGSVTLVVATAKDATASNITLKNNPAGTELTIATIAKGTAEGGVVGSSALVASTVAFSSTGTMQIVSSGSGNVRAAIFYTN